MTDVYNPINSDEDDDDDDDDDSSDSSDEMEEKITYSQRVKDDYDIEKKPPAVQDDVDNEKKPPAIKDPSEIAMELMKKMGYSPDTCPPEVVNKLKAFMKVKKELLEAVEKHPPTPQQCVTPTKEQHASTADSAWK